MKTPKDHVTSRKEAISFRIVTKTKWYKRIWYLISNPFFYTCKGKWRL